MRDDRRNTWKTERRQWHVKQSCIPDLLKNAKYTPRCDIITAIIRIFVGIIIGTLQNMNEIFIILLLILLNGVFAMSEIAIISVRKGNMQQNARRGSKRPKL